MDESWARYSIPATIADGGGVASVRPGTAAGAGQEVVDEEMVYVNKQLRKTTTALSEAQVDLAIQTRNLNSAQEQCQALAALVNVAMRTLLVGGPSSAQPRAAAATNTGAEWAAGAGRRSDGKGGRTNDEATRPSGGAAGRGTGGGGGAGHSADWSLDHHPGAQDIPFPMSAATRAFLQSGEEPSAPAADAVTSVAASGRGVGGSSDGAIATADEGTLEELDSMLKSYVQRKVQSSFTEEGSPGD